MTIRLPFAALVALLSISASPLAQQHPAMPAGMTHDEHLAQLKKDAEMKERGAQAMGFDQNTTTHHFRLTRTGGAIEVSVNDTADTVGRDQIRAHLKDIAGEFSTGQFEKPLMTHAEVPPGVETMTRLAAKIRYSFKRTSRGGAVLIETADLAARDAVYDFLRYQIVEHATGDPLTAPR